MITLDLKFDGEAMQRKILATVQKQAINKLRQRGILSVTVKVVMDGNDSFYQLSGGTMPLKWGSRPHRALRDAPSRPALVRTVFEPFGALQRVRVRREARRTAAGAAALPIFSNCIVPV